MPIGRISSSMAMSLLVISTTIGVLAWSMWSQAGHVEAQSTITVNKTGDTADEVYDGDCSIREAIHTASSGDTIVIPAGTYTLALGEIIIAKNLTLTGVGVVRP